MLVLLLLLSFFIVLMITLFVLLTFMLFVSIEFCPFALVVFVLALLLSGMISTLNLTFLDRNLSGDLYSQRNKLGLFIL